MRIKSLVAAMAAVASLAPIAAQAQAQENPWMVRVRAVDVLFQNGQSGLAQSANLRRRIVGSQNLTYLISLLKILRLNWY